MQSPRFTSLTAAALLPALILGASCDTQDCTTAGCGTTLEVQIEGPDGGALPDSTYEVALYVGEIPFSTACGSPEPGMFQCEPVEGGTDVRVDAFTFNGKIFLHVWDEGDEGDSASTVSLSVLAGDAPLVDETWDVTYETVYPNGEACGPVCRSATELFVATIDLEP